MIIFELDFVLRKQWSFLTILKISNRSVWSDIFWLLKVYLFCKFIQQSIQRDKTQMFKKLLSNKIKIIFFGKLHLITILLLIFDSYISWSTKLIFLKFCVGFSIFDSVSFLLSFYFCPTKSIDSWTLKRHNSFQN